MSVTILCRRTPPRPTVVFDTYWAFAARRQAVFFSRLEGASPPWSSDEILGRYRFTNTYRVLDRVSQYLIREVIPAGDDDDTEIFFRVMLFKIFNKIETWETLRAALGETPSWTAFDLEAFDAALSRARRRGHRIYSAAYIMPPSSRFGPGPKHRTHLRLLEWMMRNHVAQRVVATARMSDAFELLRRIHSIGDFLAYQFVTDLNYSSLTDFSEMEFVRPGPGALDGIAKCFSSLGDDDEADVIRWAAETQVAQFESRGLSFRSLFGRPLQLIDCQNLFCEVSKYARLAHPGIVGPSGRTRIKQTFRPIGPLPPLKFPTKWGLGQLEDHAAAAL